MGLVNDFKAFIMRGNVVDLAVAVVIGAAFKSIVDALVADFITPLIAAIAGKQDFSSLTFSINDSIFRYGDFFNQVLSFVIIAAVIFFFVVMPVNALMARRAKEAPADPSIRHCPECTSNISALAKRCPMCTAQITPTAAA
jgi:large conductance mechanosensitive channel